MLSWLFSDPLPVGSSAPAFTVPDERGKPVSLLDYRGKKNVVLVFYPGDDTTICTKQLCEFRDRWGDVGKRDTIVFGVNPQGEASHGKFRSKYNLPFPLLVDKGQALAKLYQANGLIVKRTVYLIGKSGTIRYAKRGKPEPGEVLAAAE